MGAITTWPPRLALHKSLPVRASSAWKYPSRPPVNSRSDAVVRMPASVRSYIGKVHLRLPVLGSIATTAPWDAALVHVLIGPRRRFGGTAASGPGGADR